MHSNEQELDLSKCAMEMNICLYAFTETVSLPDFTESRLRLRHSGDSVVKDISNALEFEGRMTKCSFRETLERAKNTNESIQLQLASARKSKIGDVRTLDKTEYLCTDVAHGLDRLIRSLGLEAGG